MQDVKGRRRHRIPQRALSEGISKKCSLWRNKEGKEESTKATAESVATKNADSQSHHSRRASCRRFDSACCERKVSIPSSGEELGLFRRRPSMDSMFLSNRPLHHHIKPLLQKKATEKWYRLVPIRNLTGGSAWRGTTECVRRRSLQ